MKIGTGNSATLTTQEAVWALGNYARMAEEVMAPLGPVLVDAVGMGPGDRVLDVKPSAAGRMVDRLVSAGLIDRQPHPTSRRELLAVLSPRGRKIVRQVTAHRRREIAGIVEKMPPAQRRGLVRALTAFTAAGGEPAAGLDGDD